ncbi:mercury resistance system transport protein MerF [Siccirubricoccus sp. KC 17139]|uniref:Mercury resistance system transport protein MerF n=1 Tax=Siccirubricoccus soli TaxID=2899147 RepID=A0ABT1D2E7_9PROT|nr:mercury resistance system transport protein MerF [Siccirubricoccus soli]MCO6416088.1 mercury resistance system transport protein MerF [Siccirubricoccus soli]MCP2682220.1 mercury resistance system transport protein MerF [Siccirubricoccus soli]
MENRKLMATGIVGFMVAALCCSTPVLAVLLGAVGLSAVLGYLDYVLIPAMVLFLGIIAYAAYRRRGSV